MPPAKSIVYERHVKGSGGVLYQIKLPAAEVAAKVYPAGGMGLLNPYKGKRDLCSALEEARQDLLSANAATAADAASYLCHLQARVFVPPHQALVMVLQRMDVVDRLTFASKHAGVITDGKKFTCVLEQLAKADRLLFEPYYQPLHKP